MRTFYDVVLFIYNSGIGLAAFFGNKKAKLWLEGRRDWELKLKNDLISAGGKKRIWFHCASLGEFEQGRPLIEKIKENDPSHFIVLSFFSPSGYELRKNYPGADVVCYLPVDTRNNSKKFIELVSPTSIIFIKYEFWLHYFEEAGFRKIPLFIVSAVFRPSQIFFKWYGGFYRKILKNVEHFFVQDDNSLLLLSRFGFKNITVTGDTRFDRVHKISLEKKNIPVIENFKQGKKLFIAGSTWPEDETIIFRLLNTLKKNNYKIIIAPHEVNEKRIQELRKNISEFLIDSEVATFSTPVNVENARILIIDNIGLLSSIYGYGELAWIGGGFGRGIHNILEAAVFGMPVIFGPEYMKFNEAVELISAGGAFTVKNSNEALQIINELISNDEKLKKCSIVSSNYINFKTGATNKIFLSLQNLKYEYISN